MRNLWEGSDSRCPAAAGNSDRVGAATRTLDGRERDLRDIAVCKSSDSGMETRNDRVRLDARRRGKTLESVRRAGNVGKQFDPADGTDRSPPLDIGEVDRELIHADLPDHGSMPDDDVVLQQTDDLRSLRPDMTLRANGIAVGIADRHDPDQAVTIRLPVSVVADGLPAGHRTGLDDAACPPE